MSNKNSTSTAQPSLLNFFFEKGNFAKKRQKAYLKGDKYFTYGIDLNGKPKYYLTNSKEIRTETQRTTVKHNNGRGSNKAFSRGYVFYYDQQGVKVVLPRI